MSTTSTNFNEVVFIYRYGVSIDVKVEGYVRKINTECNRLLEKSFVDRMDHAESRAIWTESEICLAIVRWASECGGFIMSCLNEERNREHFLNFQIEFDQKSKFDRFSEDCIYMIQNRMSNKEVNLNERVFVRGYDAQTDVKMDKWVSCGICSNSLWECERILVTKRDYAKTETEKRMFDTFRATVKWAQTCGATLLGIRNHVIIAKQQSYMRFDFRFDSKYFFDEFEESLVSNVKGAVM